MKCLDVLTLEKRYTAIASLSHSLQHNLKDVRFKVSQSVLVQVYQAKPVR